MRSSRADMDYDYGVPEISGEPGAWPERDSWAEVMEANRSASASWAFEVAGRPVGEMRALARSEALAEAYAWSRDAGINVRTPGDPAAPLVMSGHQPELYHCGVWVKQFALEDLAEKTGASAVNIVVDSDSFDDVGFSLPCRDRAAIKCRYVLAVGGKDTCFSCEPPPSPEAMTDALAGARKDARQFGEVVGERLERFMEALKVASASSSDLGESLTRARRMHEGASTGYLELPMSRLASGRAFRTFLADIVLRADAFHGAYNAELEAYRAERRLRSKAQPFANLGVDGTRIELPFWVLGDGRRVLWVETRGEDVRLFAGEEPIASIPKSADQAVEGVTAIEHTIVPKALALTLFTRVFCSDLLIHGLGGARYDVVTDRVCRSFYGVDAPTFVTITLTMRLPGEDTDVNTGAVAALRARINRLEHNPDEQLHEAGLKPGEEALAAGLVDEKRRMVASISEPGADKKALGTEIRRVNAALGAIVAPLRERLRQELLNLERQQACADVLTDRDYPFFLWSPDEVAATLIEGTDVEPTPFPFSPELLG